MLAVFGGLMMLMIVWSFMQVSFETAVTYKKIAIANDFAEKEKRENKQ